MEDGPRRSSRLRKRTGFFSSTSSSTSSTLSPASSISTSTSSINKKRNRKDSKDNKGKEEDDDNNDEISSYNDNDEEEINKDNNGTFFKLPSNQSTLKDKHEIIDWSEWVAASATKNYMMDDGFLDVLACKSSAVIKADPNYSNEIAKMIRLTTNTSGFVPNLMQSGNLFETKVIQLIIKELGKENVLDIGGNHNARSTQKYHETIQALNDGIPCIYQGILRNYENKTYGVSDILIRSDWINKLLDVNALSPDEIHVSATNLKNPCKNSLRYKPSRMDGHDSTGSRVYKSSNRRNTKNNRNRNRKQNVPYHYIVVDIKYKTLPLRSDGIHLRNDSNMKAYKSQLWIYNDALSKIQGYSAPYAFILGSKWKYVSSNTTFEGNSCFNRLGRIDYDNLDNSYVQSTAKAVQWLNDVRLQGDKWDLSKYPLPRDELYPNMCNHHDYPYHGIKKTYAENNKDLTLIWNVGPKQRRIANAKGVYNWDDKKCTPQILGVNGKVRSKVIGRILEANHSEGRNIFPKYILHNFADWKNREGRKLELFVDFETTCSVFSEMEELPLNTGMALIFLIGVGYIHPESGEWVFNKFVVNKIDEEEEIRICNEFIEFINNLKKNFSSYISPDKNSKDSLILWHYSHAEPSFWRRAFERAYEKKNIGRKLKTVSENLDWTDLMKVFLLEPIGVKGCLSYNLKTLAKNFHQHGYIQTKWDSESNTADGADAAIFAYQASLECDKNGNSFANHSLTLDIIKYNEVDCKVLQEILYYLREHHISPSTSSFLSDDVGNNEVEDIDNEDNDNNKIFLYKKDNNPIKKRKILIEKEKEEEEEELSSLELFD